MTILNGIFKEIHSNIIYSSLLGVEEIEMISSIVFPVSAALLVGQSLDDTPNWNTFLNVSNYIPREGETINSVTVDYSVGDVPDDTTAFTDGQTINFRFLVTDTSGEPATVFNVVSRLATYPSPSTGNSLADQDFVINTGIQTYDVSGDFSGSDLTYSINVIAGVTINQLGIISFDTDNMALQAGTAVVVTVSNSGGNAVSGFSFILASVQFTATTAPQDQRMYEGQLLGDFTDMATYLSSGNYSSTGGTISSVAALVNGLPEPNLNYVLAEGDTVEIQPTDSAANTHEYQIEAAVEYMARVTGPVNHVLGLDINSIVPDSQAIPINVLTAPYAGSYSPTAGELRGPDPYNFIGTVTVTSDGDINNPLVGDTLTGDDGLWHITGGTFSIIRQWYRDGAPIAGTAGSNTYVLVQADIDASTVSFRPTCDDGINTPTAATSGPIAMPGVGGPVGDVPTILGAGIEQNVGGNTTTHNVSGAANGERVWIGVHARFNAVGKIITGLLYDGVAANARVISPQTGDTCVAWFSVIKGIETSVTLTVQGSSGLQDVQTVVMQVGAWTTWNTDSDSSSSASSISTQNDTVVDGAIMSLAADKGGGGGDSLDFTVFPTNFVEVAQRAVDVSADLIVGAGATDTAVTGQTITATPSPAPDLAIATVSFTG